MKNKIKTMDGLDKILEITEDYVPFYIAELLAEKGFDIPLKTAYNADKKAFETNELQNFNGTRKQKTPDYSRPTVQMVCKWLRVKHNISLFVYPTSSYNKNYGEWEGGACWIAENCSVIFYSNGHALFGDTYEQTLNELIQYVLIHIIHTKE